MNDVPIVRFFETVTVDTFWDVLKIFYMVGIFLYMLFAVVMIRQVQQMINTLNGHFVLPLRLVAWVHLLVAVGVLLLAWVML